MRQIIVNLFNYIHIHRFFHSDIILNFKLIIYKRSRFKSEVILKRKVKDELFTNIHTKRNRNRMNFMNQYYREVKKIKKVNVENLIYHLKKLKKLINYLSVNSKKKI